MQIMRARQKRYERSNDNTPPIEGRGCTLKAVGINCVSCMQSANASAPIGRRPFVRILTKLAAAKPAE